MQGGQVTEEEDGAGESLHRAPLFISKSEAMKASAAARRRSR